MYSVFPAHTPHPPLPLPLPSGNHGRLSVSVKVKRLAENHTRHWVVASLASFDLGPFLSLFSISQLTFFEDRRSGIWENVPPLGLGVFPCADSLRAPFGGDVAEARPASTQCPPTA